ncbi:ATP-dependent RNA helicase dbp4, partial [Ceratobasidium sp. 394]
MPPPKTTQKKRKSSLKRPFSNQKSHRLEENAKLEQLEKLVQDFDLSADHTLFNDLPISNATKRGLKKAFYTTMTDIQAKSLP